jgi:hypothetical protein
MWARVCGALAGVWLMVAPSVLGYGGAARVSDLVAGPIAVSASVIAMSQVTRPVRWATLPVGAWVIVAAWLLDAPAEARVGGMLAGVMLIGVALVRGRVRERFGGGWTALWRRGDA